MAFHKAMQLSKQVAMSLSDKFCVDRHKDSFLELVKNKLDITFANEQEIKEAKSYEEIIDFGKSLNKLLIVTRSDKGSVAIQGKEVVECSSKENLKIVDLTGAGDLFAAGFLHGYNQAWNIKQCLEMVTDMASQTIH